MMAAVCTICGGKKSDHFDSDGKPTSIHAYTEREGDLQTPEQKARETMQRAPMQIPPMAIAGGNIQLGRLIEVLMDKGLLGVEDALYIGMMAPKPQNSGFKDPAVKL